MKKLLIILFMTFGSLYAVAEQIASIEQTGSWVNLYNSKGRQYKSISTSTVGTVVGYSATFFVSENGSWIYLWDSDGKRYKTLSKSTVGDVIGVAGDTFTSRSGSWIYTWDKSGKKIGTRHAS